MKLAIAIAVLTPWILALGIWLSGFIPLRDPLEGRYTVEPPAK